MSTLASIERHGGVALLTLNRPAKRNALSLELRAELTGALRELAADETVRCVIITGAGTAFCAGMDTSEFGGDRAHKERIVELSIGLFRALGSFPTPIVAAINGPAIAGGFALALLCDVRMASARATMGFLENRAGIPPSYAAARAALPASSAADLCMSGRLLSADEALAAGVIRSVHADETLAAAARDLATTIAAAPPSATRETKRRIVIERQTVWGPLFEAEERALREALLGSS